MKIINYKKILTKKSLAIILVIVLILFSALITKQDNFVFANTEVDQLNKQISEKERELNRINAEIRRLEASATDANNRSNSLQNTIDALEASKRKITSEIQETELEIERTNLTLSKLEREIADKEISIENNSEALAKSIRLMNSLESVSLIERFLGYDNISDFWTDFEQTQKIQKTLHTEVESLLDLYDELQKQEEEEYRQRQELASYRSELSSEQVSVEYTQEEQARILQQTRSEEARYQEMLAEKRRQREAFEKQLLEIESQLNFLIDADSFPNPRNGILTWPADNIIVTQQFGGTAFAKQNPHVYGRASHPGTDFGLPVGSKIYSVDSGSVRASGNTDAHPGCYAWGKWILVDHDNGLSSLYAHLSSISVSEGQRVSRGDVIGLSGNTGYSTGPHLHLTVYASQGVKVGKYGDYKPGGSGCAATNATGPFADLDAYLDPMQYLPSL